MSYVARDLKDVANLVARKLEDYMNNERVEARFQPLGCYRTTKKMQNFDLLTRVMECSDLDYVPAQNMKRKKSPARKSERHKSPEGKMKKKSKSLKKDQPKERRATSIERKKIGKDKTDSSHETESENSMETDRRGEREKLNTKEAKILKKETWMRLIDAKDESPVDHKLKINPKLDKTTRTVVAKKEAARLSEYASHVFEKQPIEKLQVIHRYRPHSQDIPHLTENGKVQNYTCHVGSALHTKQYVDYYMKEGLQTGKKEYSKRLQHLKTRETGSDQGSEKSSNQNASRSTAIFKNGGDSLERKRGKLPPIRPSECISPRSTLSTDSHDSSVSRYTASSFSSGLESTYKIMSTPRNRPTTAAQSYPDAHFLPLQPHPPNRPRNMEITTKIEFRPPVRQAFVETGGNEIQSIQMLNRASSTTDLLPMLDTFTQTPRDDMSEQSLKVLTVSGDSFLDQETQTPRSVTHKKKKKKKKSDDPSYLEGDEVARPVTRARSRRRTGVSSVSDVNVSMTESSMCDSTSVSASDTSVSQASYSLESARVVKKAQICQTSFSFPSESLYTTETSFSQQSDQSISKESILPNPMVSENVSSLTNSTMHIYKSSLASVHDSASVPGSEEQNERSGNTQETRAEIGNSEEYYSYDRAGEKENGSENITGEKEREAPQSEGTKQFSSLDSAQCDDDPFWDDTEKDTVEVSYGSSIVKPSKMDEKKDWSTELKSQSRFGTPRTPDIITVVNTPRDESETFQDDIVNNIINDTSVEETCRGNVELPEVDEDPRGDTLFSNMDETKENYVGNFNEEKTQGSNVAYRKFTSDYCYVPEDRGMDGESFFESEPENEMYIKSSSQTGIATNEDEDLDISRGVIPPKRKVSDASSHCSEIRAVGDGCPIYRQEIFDRPPSRCSQVSSVRGSGKTSSIAVPDETLNGTTSSLNETQDLLTEDELAKMIDDLKIVDEAPQEKPDLPKRSPSSCSRGSGDVPYSGQSSFLRGIEETSPEEENIQDKPELFVEHSLPESRGGGDAIASKGEEDAPEPPAESAFDTSSCRGSGILEVCTSGVLSRGNEGDRIRTDTSREPIVENSVIQQEDMTKGDLLESKIQDISSFEDNPQCTSSPQGFDNGLLVPTSSEGTQENDVKPETLKDERIENDQIVKSCPGVEKQMSNTQDDNNYTSDNVLDKKLSKETTVSNETQDINQGCVLDHSHLSTTRGGFADESSLENATLEEESTGNQPFDICLTNEGSAETAASTEDVIAKDSKATYGSDERRTEGSQKESDSTREVCQNKQDLPTVSTKVTKRSSSVKSPRKPRSVSGRPGGHCPDIVKDSDKTKLSESECSEENVDTDLVLNESRGLADNVIKETPKLLEDKKISEDTTNVGEENANTFVINESRGLFEIEDFEQPKEEPTADKNEGSIDKTCDGSVAVANEEIANSDTLILSETETNNFRTSNNQEADDLETHSQGMTQHETEISSESRQSEDTATPEDASNVTADYSMERGETTDTPREETIVTAPRLQRSPSVCSRGSVSEECPPQSEPSERSPEENAHATEQSGEHQQATEMSVEKTHSNEMTEEKQILTASIESLSQISTTNAASGEEILPVAETSTSISEEIPSASEPFNENPEENMPAIEPGNNDAEANTTATEPSNKAPEDNPSATEPSNKGPEDNQPVTEPSNKGPEDNQSVTEPSNMGLEDNPSVTEPSNMGLEDNPSVTEPSNMGLEDNQPVTEPSNKGPEDNQSVTEPSNMGLEDNQSVTEPSNMGLEDNPSVTEPSNMGLEDNPSVTEPSNMGPEDNQSVTEPSNKGPEDNPSATEQISKGPGANSTAYESSSESSDTHPPACEPSNERKEEIETNESNQLKINENEPNKTHTESTYDVENNVQTVLANIESDEHSSKPQEKDNQLVSEMTNEKSFEFEEKKFELLSSTIAEEKEKADELQDSVRENPSSGSVDDDTAKVVGNTAKLEVEQPDKSLDRNNGKVDESEHCVKEGSMEEPVESAGEANGMIDKDTANITTGSFVAAEYPSQHGILVNDIKVKEETEETGVDEQIEKSKSDVNKRPDVEKHDTCLSPMNFFAEEGNSDVQKYKLLEQEKEVSNLFPKDSAEEKDLKASTQIGPVNFFTGDESEIFSPDQTFVQSSITGDSTMYLSAESTETTATSDSSKLESSTPENLQYVTLQPESTPEKSQDFELVTASKSDEDASNQTEHNELSHHVGESAATETNRENISDKLPCDVEESEEFTRLPVAQERRMSVESRGSRCSEQEATFLSSPRADASFMNGSFSMLPNETVPQSEQHINGAPVNDMPFQQTDIEEEEKPVSYSTLSTVLVSVQQTEASISVDEKILNEPSPLESNPTEVDVYLPAGETIIVDIAVLPQASSERGSDGNAYHSFLDGKQSAGISNEVSTGLEEEEMKDLSFEIGEAVDKTIQMVVSQEYSLMKKHDKIADKSCTEMKREVNDNVSSSLRQQEQSILLVSDCEDKSLIKRSPDDVDVNPPKEVLATLTDVTTPEKLSPDKKDQVALKYGATHPNDAQMSLQVKDQDASDKKCTKLQDSLYETSSQAEELSAHPKDGDVPKQPSAQPEEGDSPGEQSAYSKEEDVSEEPFIHPKEGDVPEEPSAPPKEDVSEEPSAHPKADVPKEPSAFPKGDVPEEPSAPSKGDVEDEPSASAKGGVDDEPSASPEEARGGEEEDCKGLATPSEDFEGGESGTLNTHETKMTPGQTDIVETSEETKGSDNGKVRGSKDESAGTNGNLMLGHQIILVSENVPPPFPKAKIIGKDVDGSQLILVSEKPQV